MSFTNKTDRQNNLVNLFLIKNKILAVKRWKTIDAKYKIK
jgi:hypothetical protein